MEKYTITKAVEVWKTRRWDLLKNSEMEVRECVFTAFEMDLSDAHSGYDSRCSFCWINAPHTINAHNDRIELHILNNSK